MNILAEKEASQPSGLPPSRDPKRRTVKRKLYQSCDHCRQRRKACDAVSLGVNPYFENTSNAATSPKACTACQKVGKPCTFKWLQNLPTENLPQGVKSRLSAGNHPSWQRQSSDDSDILGGVPLPEASAMSTNLALPATPKDVDWYVAQPGAAQEEHPASITDAQPTSTANLQLGISGALDLDWEFDTSLLDNGFGSSLDDGPHLVQSSSSHLETYHAQPIQGLGESHALVQPTEFGGHTDWDHRKARMDSFLEHPGSTQSIPRSPNVNIDATSGSQSSRIFESQIFPVVAPTELVSTSTALASFHARPRVQLKSKNRDQRQRFARKERLENISECNECRAKEAFCDGNRPTCSSCERLGVLCTYHSNNSDERMSRTLKNQLGQLRDQIKQHSDFLEHLRSVPVTDALETIRRLRSTRNVSNVLSSIKGSACTTARPSLLQTARALMSFTESGIEFELNIQYNIAYPALDPVDLDSIDLGGLPRHTLGTFQHRSASGSDTSSHTSPEEYGVSLSATSSSPSHPYGIDFEETPLVNGPMPTPHWCDFRLEQLNIRYWTTVPISNETAANIISNYLESDHNVFACFDVDLFLSDLVNQRLDYCSPLLVNALMTYASQSYTAFDLQASDYSMRFLKYSLALQQSEQTVDSATNISALCFLSMGTLLIGNDGLAVQFARESYDMGVRMKLFGVLPTGELVESFRQLPLHKLKELSHAAWGTYAHLTFRNGYFPDRPIDYPPALPIPGDPDRTTSFSKSAWPSHPLPEYMGQTFTTFCKYWVIVQEIESVYHIKGDTPLIERATLSFTEMKYRKLLAWSTSLPGQMLRGEHSPAQILLFHGLFHTTVLFLFRPFLTPSDQPQLRSFSSVDCNPSSIYAASLNQLKRILYLYSAQPPYPSNLVWFNAPITQIGYSTIQNHETDPYWHFYFRMCFQYWKKSYICYRIFAHVVQAFLTLALRLDALNSAQAKALLEEIQIYGAHHGNSEDAKSCCVIDLDSALSDEEAARMYNIAEQFEELLQIKEVDDSGPEVEHAS